MARIAIEQRALADARFRKLGRLLLDECRDSHLAQCIGLGWMTFVFNECQERGSYALTNADLAIITDREDAATLIIESGLGEALGDAQTRIKGTEGRIEWLENARRVGRENGSKGGRPRKTDSGLLKNQVGLGAETPPPTATTPAISSSERRTKESLSGDSDAYRLARLLESEIAKSDPAFRANVKAWATEMDRLLRIDGRSVDEAAELIRFAQRDGFWRSNILSPAKLRKQFTQLKLKRTEQRLPEKATEPTPSMPSPELAALIAHAKAAP